MAQRNRDLLSALTIVANNRHIQVTVQNSAKGAAICAASALIGGLLLGPRGLAMGGVVGGLAAYGLTEGEFKSLGEVISNDLSESERTELREHITNAISEFSFVDALEFGALILKNREVQNVAVSALRSFFNDRMSMTIVD
ncbi:hypothetical protein KR009_010092 [Drosophila setifemur]|nr:hypothetical protein KR009_010092 [Drosophila setifemur]